MNKRGLSNLVDRGKSVWRDWMKTESALQQKEGGGRTETHHQFLTRQLTLTPKKFRSWMESSCWLSIFPPVFFLFTRPLLLRRNNKFQLRFDSPPPPSLDRAARNPNQTLRTQTFARLRHQSFTSMKQRPALQRNATFGARNTPEQGNRRLIFCRVRNSAASLTPPDFHQRKGRK